MLAVTASYFVQAIVTITLFQHSGVFFCYLRITRCYCSRLFTMVEMSAITKHTDADTNTLPTMNGFALPQIKYLPDWMVCYVYTYR